MTSCKCTTGSVPPGFAHTVTGSSVCLPATHSETATRFWTASHYYSSPSPALRAGPPHEWGGVSSHSAGPIGGDGDVGPGGQLLDQPDRAAGESGQPAGLGGHRQAHPVGGHGRRVPAPRQGPPLLVLRVDADLAAVPDQLVEQSLQGVPVQVDVQL